MAKLVAGDIVNVMERFMALNETGNLPGIDRKLSFQKGRNDQFTVYSFRCKGRTCRYRCLAARIMPEKAEYYQVDVNVDDRRLLYLFEVEEDSGVPQLVAGYEVDEVDGWVLTHLQDKETGELTEVTEIPAETPVYPFGMVD